MEELIQKLQSIHGLSAEQSHGILNTITTFIKEKFPMVAGAIDNFFPPGTTPSASVTQHLLLHRQKLMILFMTGEIF